MSRARMYRRRLARARRCYYCHGQERLRIWDHKLVCLYRRPADDAAVQP